MRKIDRTEVVKYLNTTPLSDTVSTENFEVIGTGIEDEATDMNPNISKEHWIVNKNENKSVDSYAPASSIEQTAYEGDPVFDFVDNLAYIEATGDKAVTQLLEIYKYRVVESEDTVTYKAKKYNVAISIKSAPGGKGGEGVKIKYDINYVGDPTLGTVVFTSGKPVFTAQA